MDPEYLWYRLHGTIENARTSYGGPAIEPQYLRPRWLAPQAVLRLPGTASPSFGQVAFQKLFKRPVRVR